MATEKQRELAIRLYKQTVAINKTITAAVAAGLTVEVIATDNHEFSPLWSHLPRWRLDLKINVSGEVIDGAET